MTFDIVLQFCAAALSGGLALLALLRNARAFAHRVFAAGMVVLSVGAVFAALSFKAAHSADLLRWQHLRLVTDSLLPSIWLLFGVSFARANYQTFLVKWKWGALGALVIPLSLTALFHAFLFKGADISDISPRWVLQLGWSGIIYHICFLLCSVLILLNLEKTLQASSGLLRSRIKTMLLGVGALFAARIYTTSEVLLFSSLSSQLSTIDAGALVVADLLIVWYVIRSGLKSYDIYLSREFVYSSLSVLIVGFYLLAVGLLGKASRYLTAGAGAFTETFLVFLALLGLTIFLLSDQLRYRIRRFILRHFERPRHDYRGVWTAFTLQTNSLTDLKDLGVAVVKIISDTFGAPAVSFWLLDETRQRPILYGSTALSASQPEEIEKHGKESAFLMLSMRDQTSPVDLDRSSWARSQGHEGSGLPVRQAGGIRYCAPLAAGGDLLGIITLDGRISGEPLSTEDLDLLKTIADQTAGIILNHRLFEELGKAKEMELFQTVSAFFVHDLKNMASTLSLTLQNLPEHYDNPEFREDALRVIAKSVSRIKDMCAQLSQMSGKLELHPRVADINEMVLTTLDTVNGSLSASLTRDLKAVPRVLLDPEQMQKVLVNLLLNAGEAMPHGGTIQVTTGREGDNVVLAVSDNGCGMSREFIDRSLFHPFKTTKKRGLGIGLYHSKMIVEAHHGRIEVISQEGRGSTFRVVLPGKV